MERFPRFLSVWDTQCVLIWVEIASRNYDHKQDCCQCNISLLVMQPDAGVNEPLAEAVQKQGERISEHIESR